MMKHIQILLMVLSVFTESHARFLSETEMQSFMEVHSREVADALPGVNAHKGYRVIAVAYERMQNNSFEDHLKSKIVSYYANVILSALKGIGFGGLSSKRKASTKEKEGAFLALYAIGYNLKGRFTFDQTGLRQERIHFQKCNEILNFGADYRSPSAQRALDPRIKKIFGTYTGSFQAKCPISSFDLAEGSTYYSSYRLAFEELQANIRRKADEDTFRNAVGKREDLRQPRSSIFGPPLPKVGSSSVPPTGSASPAKEEVEDEPWSGILYRNKDAAKTAIRRNNEEVCQNTGNLIVRFLGNPQYYSSTATLILQSSGNVVAITNAHCVDPEGGVVSSVELHMPDGEIIFFSEVYMNSEYRKITNDCDNALLKGKSTTARVLKPILPVSITNKMNGKNGFLVSCAKVNYLDKGRIVTLTDQATRTLSVLRIERTGSAPLYKAEISRVVQTTKPTSTLSGAKLSSALGSEPIVFRPQGTESHQLESALSFGCSGSPFYLKVNGIDYIAGLFNSTIYRTEGGVPTRSSCIFSLCPQQDWMNQVLMGTLRPTYILRCR